MPKIPMLNQAAVNHQSSTVHMTGAPGMNFKMDESRALINFGETLSDFGGTIANAGNKTVSAKVKFQQELQYTEDRLAAAEDRALFKEGASALNLKLAENPGASDEEKKEWVNEFQKQYIADRKQYTDRMSEKFRKLHDVEMLSISDSYARNRLEILTNAEVTRLQNEFESLYKMACERGDFAEAERIVRENSGKLFNPEVARKLLEHDLPMRRDFYSVSKLADLNPAQAVADLETTDKNGRYTNFINLSPDTRKQLLRYAKAKSAQNVTDFTQGYIAKINAGENIESVEEFKQMYQDGKISREQFNSAFPYIQRYYELTAKQNTAKEQQKLRLTELQTEAKVRNFVNETLYGPTGNQDLVYSSEDLAIKREKLLEMCGGYNSLWEKYLPKLNGAASKTAKVPDFWHSSDGKIIEKWIKHFETDADAYRWDPDGREDSNDWSAEAKKLHRLEMEQQYRDLAEELYAKYKNPKDVTEVLRWARLQLNDGLISNFLQWRENNLPQIDKKLGIPRGQKNESFRKTGR